MLSPSLVLLRWRLRRFVASLPARTLRALRFALAGLVGAAAVTISLVVGVLAVPLLALGFAAWALWPSAPASK